MLVVTASPARTGLEKKPTDLRRKTRYFGDRTLTSNVPRYQFGGLQSLAALIGIAKESRKRECSLPLPVSHKLH
jgi:hypothetical protein